MYPNSCYRHSIRQFFTFIVRDSCNAYKYVHYLSLYHFRECVTNLLGVLHLLILTKQDSERRGRAAWVKWRTINATRQMKLRTQPKEFYHLTEGSRHWKKNTCDFFPPSPTWALATCNQAHYHIWKFTWHTYHTENQWDYLKLLLHQHSQDSYGQSAQHIFV